MSSLTGKSLNPVMNRRSVIASAAGLGAMSILAGCSSNGGDSGSASGDASFKIGTIGPLTGANASYGKSVTQAVELGCKDFSTKELPLVSKAEDDQADGEKAVNAFNTLLDWGMQALVGPTTTGASVAVAAECGNDPETFMITPSASSEDVTKGKDCVFQVCFTDPNQGVASADYIADNKLGTKVGVIYDSSVAYSSGIYEKFKAEADAKGLEIVAAEAFTADNKSDLSTQVAKCQQAGADLVFLPIYYQEASQILIAANKSGYEPVFFGCDGMDGILDVEGFDTSLAEGLMLLTPFAADAQDEKTQAFVSAYVAAYGETPNQFAADAYDAIYAIKAAMEEADITPETSVSDTCDKMKEAMLKIKVNGLTGEDMTWTEDGEPHKAPKAVKVVDGAYQAM